MDQNIAMVILLVVVLLLVFSRGGTTHQLSAYTNFDISKVTPRTIVNSLGLLLAIVGVQKMLRHPMVSGDSIKGTDGLAAGMMGKALEAGRMVVQSPRIHSLANKVFPKPTKREPTQAESSLWAQAHELRSRLNQGRQAHELKLKAAADADKTFSFFDDFKDKTQPVWMKEDGCAR
jgi:hypothetical protein